MGSFLRVCWQIIWPPAAPVRDRDESSGKWWIATSVLSVLLLTAVFHNRFFWKHNCMLIPFGPDYTLSVIKIWLRKDPSLPWAVIGSFVIYMIGKRNIWLRVLMAPMFISFLPVTLWIWDIPFTHRIICRTLHEGNSVPLTGVYLMTRHALIVSMALYLPFMFYFTLTWRRREKDGEKHIEL